MAISDNISPTTPDTVYDRTTVGGVAPDSIHSNSSIRFIFGRSHPDLLFKTSFSYLFTSFSWAFSLIYRSLTHAIFYLFPRAGYIL